jgi:hypothetical protein
VSVGGAEGGVAGTSFLSMPPLVKGLRGRFLRSRLNSAPPILTVSFFLKSLRGDIELMIFVGDRLGEAVGSGHSRSMASNVCGESSPCGSAVGDLGERGTDDGRSSMLSLVTCERDSSESLGGMFASELVVFPPDASGLDSLGISTEYTLEASPAVLELPSPGRQVLVNVDDASWYSTEAVVLDARLKEPSTTPWLFKYSSVR